MTDLVPGPEVDGSIRIVKLINGDELVGMVHGISLEKIIMTYPAKIEYMYSKDKENNLIEYVKLTNYAANMKNYEFVLNTNALLCIGTPVDDVKKMYETYCVTMQTDPSALLNNNSSGDVSVGPEAGLHMLNELFNNEDFVNFVNDLIDNFEGVEVDFEDTSEDSEEIGLESVIEEDVPEESPKPPKAKKRRIMNPEPKKLPYKPNSNPNEPESWSDNPNDYI